jgi:hypothetical protein
MIETPTSCGYSIDGDKQNGGFWILEILADRAAIQPQLAGNPTL